MADISDLHFRHGHSVRSTTLGFLLARWKVLPSTTAGLGLLARRGTVVGADGQRVRRRHEAVAVMHYLRVASVGLVASVVARLWAPSGAAAPIAIDWFPPLAVGLFLETWYWPSRARQSASYPKSPPVRLPCRYSPAQPCRRASVVTITLPPWLLAGCYRPGLAGLRPQVHAVVGVVAYAGDNCRGRSSPPSSR